LSRPLVSVVMPVYNAESFLAEALDSVFAQDYEPIEVLVVNDGSSDRSGEIARSFSALRYFEQENRGAGVARNVAIAQAQGDYIAFVDADDVVPPSKLSLQVGYLEDHDEISGVLGRQVWTQEPPGAVRDAVYGDLDGIPLMSLVIRRSVLLEMGELCNPPSEDMDMMIRLRAAGHRVEVLPEVVLYRRYHGANLFAGQGLGPLRISSLKAQLDARRARGEGS
jgi:glycosyltransferase involved in cell wall biosynthesis